MSYPKHKSLGLENHSYFFTKIMPIYIYYKMEGLIQLMITTGIIGDENLQLIMYVELLAIIYELLNLMRVYS